MAWMRKLGRDFRRLFTSEGVGKAWAFFRLHLTPALISLGMTFVGLVAYCAMNWSPRLRSLPIFVFLDNVEARSLDARFNIRGPIKPDPRIAIVAIDQKTIDKLSWPFARSHYARMLDTLSRDGAKVVGFDVDFPLPDRLSGVEAISTLEKEYRRNHASQHDDEFLKRLAELKEQADSDALFAKAIEKSGNVVLGHLFFGDRAETKDLDPKVIEGYDELLVFQAYNQVLKRPSKYRYGFSMDAPEEFAVEPNLKLFADKAKSFGSFNFEADSDGTFRREQLIFRYKDPLAPPDENDAFFPSLDVEVARVFLGAGPDDTKVWFNPNGPDSIELGSKTIITDISGKVLINFAGPAQTYPYYSLSDVADGATPKDTFRDKIVIVGATATGIGDMRPIPFAKQSYPGVEIHANVLDNILNNNFLHHGFSEEITDLIVLLVVGGPVMGALFVLLPPIVSTGVYLLSGFAVGAFAYYNFSVYGRWIAVVLPLTILSVKFLAVLSYRVLTEEKEKRKVTATFGQYVSPERIKQILKNPEGVKLGGEEAELTILFSDIRGFTSISEGLTPAELVELLNEYLGAMADVIKQNEGTLDKYIGDAVMAFWGRPLPQTDHAARACRTALEMSGRLRELNANWASQGKAPLKIGIGVNTGPMIVGDMGSSMRRNYTAMGDHVNLGSRVEGLTKEYGVQIIVTEFTHKHIASQFITRELDLIRVKGKRKPVAIYELMAPISEHARYDDLLRDFEEGIVEYKAGNWDDACRVFEQLAEKYPSDGPTQLFLERCRAFAEEAPEGVWDGVFTMTHK